MSAGQRFPLPHRIHGGIRRAFTLVELLVVIFIIALLIGILLPTLSKARDRGRTVACMSNMRQVFQALRSYATENKDSLPYGFDWNRTNPTNGRPTPANGADYVTWFSMVDHYMRPQYPAAFAYDGSNPYWSGATKRRFSQAFKCPAVPGDRDQQVNYFENCVALVNRPHEIGIMKQKGMIDAQGNSAGPNGRVITPARFAVDLYPETALLWDTPNWATATPDVPTVFWQPHPQGGFYLLVTQIDGGELEDPSAPQLRYRKPGDRLYDPSNQGNATWINGTINFPTEEWTNANGSTAPPANNDFDQGTWNYGGPQFRHNGLGCDVLFADGSVKTLTLNKKRIVMYGSQASYTSDFFRYMLMLKWPGDKRDSGTP